ncbi:MAG: hypothetical protein U5J96_00145 [Ignavibacteriaceae bacterium]|nr:hypothetical protein [Ignavibacteriaceae bacterium]
MLFKSIGCVILSVFLLSCSAGLPVQLESQKVEKDSIAVQYSILLVIHGDNDYLYHDTSGNKYKADEKTLAEAIRVAQQNPNAEVFIFHQKPRSHFLFFFPLRDGEFYYYRNGLLIANELYWRDQELSNLDTEVNFYKSFRAESQPERVSMFLYFGHEIPELGGAGYDASYPDRTFTVHDLANGMKGFTTDSTKFDLLVLSTCYGGTPYSIGTLGPYARTVIASPDNLHLSYFDLSSLESLNLGLQDGDVPAFANRFAQQSFDRLTRNVQTAVSVAVYDVDSVQEYLHFVYPTYENTLNILSEKKKTFPATIEHCDCADIPEYVLPTMNRGVNVYYRPALFGRLKSKQNHSGWECRKD